MNLAVRSLLVAGLAASLTFDVCCGAFIIKKIDVCTLFGWLSFCRRRRQLPVSESELIDGAADWSDTYSLVLHCNSWLTASRQSALTRASRYPVSRDVKRMSEMWGFLSPTNRGPLQIEGPKHFFSTSQLNGNFSGLYLRKETWYRQSGKCVDN